MRTTALTVLLSFNFVFIFSPTALAVEAQVNKYADHLLNIEQTLESTPAKKLAHRLQKLKENVTTKLAQAVAERKQEQGFFDQVLDYILSNLPIIQTELSELSELKRSIKDAYNEEIVHFEAEAQRIESLSLPAIAKERHQAALKQVKDQYAAMIANLETLTTTSDSGEQETALSALIEQLSDSKFERSHTPEDPNNLPWGTPSSDVREPVTLKSDLLSYLDIDPYANYVQLASTGLDPSVLSTMENFNQPVAADLEETIDAQITPDIQALAAELNHNVVDIYTWVHNNIRFIPSYGSIQGAQMTLETKRGNAMDTASLTIALLRASNIPARYAYGTVEMPAEKVMNWVGGVNNANAAGNLMGQGGIPNVGIVMGGEVKLFRLEHTWVEAFVDFMPSRGMKDGSKDTWIPLDPSFKQYDYSEGLGLEQQVPFDGQALMDEIEAAATFDEDQGWVQNVSSELIEQKLEAYQQQLTDYIENQNPDATVGEVLGLQEIKILEPRPLAAGLPYDHIVTTQEFSEVPNNLRHRFKYELGTAYQGYPNTPFISINEPTVKLAGKKLALSFTPATEDDAAIIESYLPESDPETGEINPEDLPDTLPGYQINLTAEFTIDNEVIASAAAGTMGSELHEQLGFYDPRFGWGLSTNKPVAGEYQAIALDLQGSSPEYAAQLQADLEETKTKLESGDDAQLVDITKHSLVGDLLEATIFSYFALNNIQDEVAAQQADIVNYRAPSYGKFSTSLSTSYFYGTPRNVSIAGMVMDVDRVFNINVDKDNDAQKRLNYSQMVGGRYSAMEHLVPEQMFSTEDTPAEGISAVKAMALASSQGQKIWNITQDNLDLALAEINLHSNTEQEIRNSVNAGKVVTTHEQRLNYNGWVGEGYIILDPQTGAGAYKIAGGANGGFLAKLGAFLDALSWIALAFVGSGTWSGLLGSAIGPVIALVASVINLLTTIMAWGAVCGDIAAVVLFSFLAIAMFVIGLVLSLTGIFGIVVGLGIAIGMQAIATRISSSLASSCR
jgi:transglutaminase-like putative cysteine protease